MKVWPFFILLISTAPCIAEAQILCGEDDYAQMLADYRRAFSRDSFEKAQTILLAAKNCQEADQSFIAAQLDTVIAGIAGQRDRAERSARANRLAAFALSKVKTDYTLAWHAAVLAYQASLDSIEGGSTEPSVCSILHDIISDTTAWIYKKMENVRGATFSPSGDSLLVWTFDNKVKILNKYGHLLWHLKIPDNITIADVVFSPSGNAILGWNKTGEAWLFHFDSEHFQLLKEDESPITEAFFMNKGGCILIASRAEKTVWLWDSKANLISTIINVTSIAHSLDKELFATWNVDARDSIAQVWYSNGTLMRTFHISRGQILDVSLSSAADDNGNSGFLLIKDDISVGLWNRDGKMIKYFDRVDNAIFSPKGDVIATSHFDKGDLWDKFGNHIAPLEINTDHTIQNIEYSPKGNYIKAEVGNTIRLWNSQGRLLKIFEGTLSGVFSPKETYLYMIFSSQFGNKEEIWRFNRGIYLIYTIYSRNEKIVFSNSEENFLDIKEPYLLWIKNRMPLKAINHATKYQERQFTKPSVTMRHISSSLNKSVSLYYKKDSCRFYLYDKKGDELTSFYLKIKGIPSTSFSPDGQLFLIWGGWQQDLDSNYIDLLYLYDIYGNLLTTLNGQHKNIYNAIFSPDSKYMLSWGENGVAILWDIQGKLINTYHVPFTDAIFSPDGKLFLTWNSGDSNNNDYTINIWNLHGKLVTSLLRHVSYVYGAIFSPDSKFIMSWDMKTAYLWNINGVLLNMVNNNIGESFFYSQFSSDGNFVITPTLTSIQIRDKKANLLMTIPSENNFMRYDFTHDSIMIWSTIKQKWFLWENYLDYIQNRWFLNVGELLFEFGEIDNKFISQYIHSNDANELFFIGLYYFINKDWNNSIPFLEKSEKLLHSPRTVLYICNAYSEVNRFFDFSKYINYDSPTELSFYVHVIEGGNDHYHHTIVASSVQELLKIGNTLLSIQKSDENITFVTDFFARIAYKLLLLNRIAEAEKVIENGVLVQPENVALKAVFPHLLLFQPNRFEEAKKEYLNLAPKPYYSNGTFRDEFLEDFHAFRRAGIAPPRMDEIEALLKIPISK